MKENLKFIGRVTIVHITTYILCGIVFSAMFNYQELFLLENVKSFMRPFGGISNMIGPFVQVVRGALFGIVLLFIKDFFVEKYGWLKLWALIVVIGIVNTPAPAPFSIEGFIYTQLPLEFQFKGAPEILVQTLLFSYFVIKPKTEKQQNKFIEKNKIALIISIIAMIGISVSGIVLALLLNVDIMAGASDVGAFIVMFISMFIVFLITKWYCNKGTKIKAVILAIIYYIAIAIMPTTYNFIANSPFKSPLSLVINIVPTVIMMLFLYFSRTKVNKKIEHNL